MAQDLGRARMNFLVSSSATCRLGVGVPVEQSYRRPSSVGAFLLGEAGLFDGRRAVTH